MGETREQIPIENYDELFCLTVQEERKVVKSIEQEEFDRNVRYLLDIYCRQYPNDKELGTFIRRHYQRNEKE